MARRSEIKVPASQIAFNVGSVPENRSHVTKKRYAPEEKLLTPKQWLAAVRERLAKNGLPVIMERGTGDDQVVRIGDDNSSITPTEFLVDMNRWGVFNGLSMTKEYKVPVREMDLPEESYAADVYEDEGCWYRFFEKPFKIDGVSQATANLVANEVTSLYKKAEACGW